MTTQRYPLRWWTLAGWLAGTALVLFVAGPVLRLALAADPRALGAALHDPEILGAIRLSVLAASAATLIALLCGVPIAWALARGRVRGGAAVQALLDLPTVFPHPVSGIALLLFLGRDSAVGRGAAAFGVEFASAVPGIIAAMLFVAVPIVTSTAREAFAAVDPALEDLARTLGDRPLDVLRRVTLPLAGRSILAGGVLAWGRAASEFGSIVILAYHPRVASVLIVDRFTTDGLAAAIAPAVLLMLVALLVFAAARALRGAR